MVKGKACLQANKQGPYREATRSMKATKRNWRQPATIAAAAMGIALSLSSASSALPAAPRKTADRGRDSLGAVVTPLGEVIRGPRGKSQIAITFDGGANAECFEDLI